MRNKKYMGTIALIVIAIGSIAAPSTAIAAYDHPSGGAIADGAAAGSSDTAAHEGNAGKDDNSGKATPNTEHGKDPNNPDNLPIAPPHFIRPDVGHNGTPASDKDDSKATTVVFKMIGNGKEVGSRKYEAKADDSGDITVGDQVFDGVSYSPGDPVKIKRGGTHEVKVYIVDTLHYKLGKTVIIDQKVLSKSSGEVIGIPDGVINKKGSDVYYFVTKPIPVVKASGTEHDVPLDNATLVEFKVKTQDGPLATQQIRGNMGKSITLTPPEGYKVQSGQPSSIVADSKRHSVMVEKISKPNSSTSTPSDSKHYDRPSKDEVIKPAPGTTKGSTMVTPVSNKVVNGKQSKPAPAGQVGKESPNSEKIYSHTGANVVLPIGLLFTATVGGAGVIAVNRKRKSE